MYHVILLLDTKNKDIPMGNPTHTHTLEKMGNFGLGTKESKALVSISQDLWEKISTNN